MNSDKLLLSSKKSCKCFWISTYSGSTGKPKGVLHTIGGYMMYISTTFKYDFDYQPDDVYWCTADVGWITGHSYVSYGPLVNGATGLIVSCEILIFVTLV